MKKILQILSTIFLIGSLCSCDSSIFGLGLKIEGQKLINEAVEPTQEELDQMFLDDKDFIIYVYSPSCSTCIQFTEILNEVIWDNSICIYKVTVAVARNDENIKFAADATAPALIAIKNGLVKATTLYTENSEYFLTLAGFTNYLDMIAVLPTFTRGIVEITYEQFISLKTHETSFLLYVYRSGCSDCTYLNTFYWNNFVAQYAYDVDFYAFDGQEIYDEQNANTGSTIWDDAKSELGITAYLDGVVPSFVYYQDGIYNSMAVVYNDVYTWSTDAEYSYWTMTITQTYWGANSQLVGQEFTATTKAEAYYEYKTLTAGYHCNKLNNFIKEYITQVD